MLPINSVRLCHSITPVVSFVTAAVVSEQFSCFPTMSKFSSEVTHHEHICGYDDESWIQLIIELFSPIVIAGRGRGRKLRRFWRFCWIIAGGKAYQFERAKMAGNDSQRSLPTDEKPDFAHKPLSLTPKLGRNELCPSASFAYIENVAHCSPSFLEGLVDAQH